MTDTQLQVLALLVLSLGCAPGPQGIPSSTTPTHGSAATAPAKATVSPAVEVGQAPLAPCDRAGVYRARVSGLLAEGRLHRTLRVLDEANRLCPASSRSTSLVELETLAEIGRNEAARELARQLLDEAPEKELREAVAQALARLDERDATVEDSEDARIASTKLRLAAQSAEVRGEDQEAARLFEELAQRWRPSSGRALASAGHYAKRAGESARAQRLFDRAVEVLERQYRAPVRMGLASGFSSSGQLAWSPSERLLAVAEGSAVVMVDPFTGREVLRLDGGTDDVSSLTFAPDGASIAAGFGDGTLRVWRLADGLGAQTLESPAQAVRALGFSPDGKTLAAIGGGQSVWLWRVSDGALLRVLRGHYGSVFDFDFSPDGKTIASSAQDKAVRLWRTKDGSLLRTLEGHAEAVTAVAFSPDGKTIASGSQDMTLRFWRTSDGSLRHAQAAGRWAVRSISFALDGEWVVVENANSEVRICRAKDAVVLRVFGDGDQAVYSSGVVSSNGRVVALRAGNGSIELRDIAESTLIGTIGGVFHGAEVVAVAPDGATLAAASGDKVIRLWGLSDGALLRTLTGDGERVNALAYARDSKTLASGSSDGRVRLWNTPDGTRLRTLKGHRNPVLAVAFSPDSKTLASGSSDDTARLWRVADGSLLRTLDGGDSSVTAVAFAPDGRTLAMGSSSNELTLRRVADGSELCSANTHDYDSMSTEVVFAPDGRSVGTPSDPVALWQSSDCALRRALGERERSWPHHAVDLAFTADGQTLAVALRDGRVRLLRLSDGSAIRIIDGAGRLSAVRITDDGRRLITAGTEGIGIRPLDGVGPDLQLVTSPDHDVSALLVDSGQYFDVAGKERDWALDQLLLCRIGPAAFPAEVCAERAYVPGLGGKVASGNLANLEP